MDGNLKLLVVDDHAVIRDGIRLICAQMDDVDLVAEASTVEEALEAIGRSHPHVALVDLHLPSGSGIDLVRRAREQWPELRTVVLTVERDEDLVIEAMRHGAAGFITKETALPAIIDAARRAADGETVIEGLSTGRLLERFASFANEANRSAEIIAELSPREREVLRLLAGGQSNQQIGSALGISGRTAATHVASIYRKLQVTNRVDAAREAMRLGLVAPGS
ncbi:MAG TPA: response regulator transcription factor [Actinomycetota bacterium]|nr:response regulator transcription factor [Actinomycetota bacterium]